MAMNNMKRRKFLRQSLLVAGGLGSCVLSGPLHMAKALAKQRAFDDYKALVCVFLFGGNDAFNTLVPRSEVEHSVYVESRQNLSIASSTLLPITALTSDGAEYGLHPAMAEFQAMFDSGRMAIMANVGTLIEPVTLQQYRDREAGAVSLPNPLFSHNDQMDLWHSTPLPQAERTSGWAGRTADMITPLENAAVLPMNLSLRGSNLFQVGVDTIPYGLSPGGATLYSGLAGGTRVEAARLQLFESQIERQYRHVLVQAYADLQRRAFDLSTEVGAAVDSVPAPATPFPVKNPLGDMLSGVAKIIAARNALGASRQIFFVGLGGFDTHSAQAENQPELLAKVAQALGAFNTATDELGVSANVTTFTASEFGRTLTSNGDGTDHGWGGHHFIMGGAVRGQDIYGVMPSLELDGPDDTGDGRIIPTTSVDQYGATLLRWFGLTEVELNTVFPNLANFGSDDLGFMRS